MLGLSYAAIVELGEYIDAQRLSTTMLLPDSQLQSVHSSLTVNLERLSALAILPASVASHVRQEEQIWKAAMDRWKPAPSAELATDIPRFSTIHDEEKRRYSEKALAGGEIQKAKERQVSAGFVENFARDDQTLELAIRVSMSSLLIGAWTTFETLAGDLWERCLNLRPRLGVRALEAEIAPGDTSEQQEEKRRKPFKIPSVLLNDCNYDLSKSMGTLMREKWYFSRLDELRSAYEKVFYEKPSIVSPTLRNNIVDGLVAMRNCLVHRGGIVDRDFCRLVSKIPDLKLLNLGDHVPLNDSVVTRHVKGIVDHAVDLLKVVDTYLSTYPY